jgi:hypothetical protein
MSSNKPKGDTGIRYSQKMVRPPRKVDRLATSFAPEVNYIAEDGWVFIERPGKGVECVRRYDSAELETALPEFIPDRASSRN